jgi:transposase
MMDDNEYATRRVIGGVDTHKDVHVAAVLDEHGRLLDTASFAATGFGYRDCYRWFTGFGEILAVGVEGTGSWGAGLSRFLRARDLNVVEVNRPNRQVRRRKGKSDTVDAEMAARAVLAGDATVTPKAGDGPVEALRQLRLARRGAVKARTAAANQLHSLTDTAPDELRAKLRRLTTIQRARLCARFRTADVLNPAGAAKRALRSVAQRYVTLHDEVLELDRDIRHVLNTIAKPVVERYGFGYETAGTLLCAAGDNPQRITTEAGFAALCGSNPVEVSSGKIKRHRLNRAGDRHANAALWTVVMTRIAAKHPPTIAYIERRTADGLSKREAIRCLKRYVAREIYNDIRAVILTSEDSRIAA